MRGRARASRRQNGGMNRRYFIALSSAAVVRAEQKDPPPVSAAVIGHTGRGDYGHGMEKIFTGREGVTLVALADADAAGGRKTAAR